VRYAIVSATARYDIDHISKEDMKELVLTGVKFLDIDSYLRYVPSMKTAGTWEMDMISGKRKWFLFLVLLPEILKRI
jgi:hypothetical protein